MIKFQKKYITTCIGFLGLATLLPALQASTVVIDSISPVSTSQYQTITIDGSGFGTQAPYTGNSTFIKFIDWTKYWSGGNSAIGDVVTLVVKSWTDSSVVLGGFSGGFGTNGWTLSAGDSIEVDVWNAQSGSGPASITSAVSGVPEPGSFGFILGAALVGTLRLTKQRQRRVAANG